MKRYGIYLAYPPMVDMRDQGLGRHLAMLLKGAEELDDVRFIIACPRWSRETMLALFEAEQVSADRFEIVSPKGKPYALRCFEWWRAFRARKSTKPGLRQRLIKAVRAATEFLWLRLTTFAVSINGPLSFLVLLAITFVVIALLLVLGLVVSPLVLIAFIVLMLGAGLRVLFYPFRKIWASLSGRIASLLMAPQADGWALQLYDQMQKVETRRMQQKIDRLNDVMAWYCPTAFWPSFNDIKAPRLMCVPDVVLGDFPVGFASVGGDRYLNTFETVGRAIRGGEHFVAYSDSVKWETLVDRYAVRASKVAVIHHAPNDLSQWITISGFPDNALTSRHYCQTLLKTSMQRGTNSRYTSTFENGDLRFFFYASQFRPNKNVMTLLRAYQYLLRKCYLGHKLILTGSPDDLPEIGRFISKHRLENDVLFLHGLNVSELAACYKLADLVVNPSLSEGGCPFTFSEALSVGTPVVMSRISVTEEVLTDPKLQEITLFDPYDWRDLVLTIEWALHNREELLSIQLQAYEDLRQRTWSTVAREYVRALDEVASHKLCPG